MINWIRGALNRSRLERESAMGKLDFVMAGFEEMAAHFRRTRATVAKAREAFRHHHGSLVDSEWVAESPAAREIDRLLGEALERR